MIDLCDDANDGRRHKRRRGQANDCIVEDASSVDASSVDSDGEEASLKLALQLHNAEREAYCAEIDNDERLARRLQREEESRPDIAAGNWMSEIGHHRHALHAHPNLPSGRALLSGRAGLTRLALLDRDFGEADYEMLLQLDEVAGCAPPTPLE